MNDPAMTTRLRAGDVMRAVVARGQYRKGYETGYRLGLRVRWVYRAWRAVRR